MGGKSSPEYHARYYQNHKEKFKEYRRNHRLRNPDRTNEHRKARLRNYSLTPEQYSVILKEQNGLCKICGGTNGEVSLAVDHDHTCCPGSTSCGKCIRGLLCNRCNSVLGYLEDSIELLDKLKFYLQENA